MIQSPSMRSSSGNWGSFQKAVASFSHVQRQSSLGVLLLAAHPGSWQKWALQSWHPFFQEAKSFRKNLEAISLQLKESPETLMDQFSRELSWPAIETLVAIDENAGFHPKAIRGIVQGVLAFALKSADQLNLENGIDVHRLNRCASFLIKHLYQDDPEFILNELNRWMKNNDATFHSSHRWIARHVEVINKELSSGGQKMNIHCAPRWIELIKRLETFEPAWLMKNFRDQTRDMVLWISSALSKAGHVKAIHSKDPLALCIDVFIAKELDADLCSHARAWEDRWRCPIDEKKAKSTYLKQLRMSQEEVLSFIHSWPAETMGLSPINQYLERFQKIKTQVDEWVTMDQQQKFNQEGLMKDFEVAQSDFFDKKFLWMGFSGNRIKTPVHTVQSPFFISHSGTKAELNHLFFDVPMMWHPSAGAAQAWALWLANLDEGSYDELDLNKMLEMGARDDMYGFMAEMGRLMDLQSWDAVKKQKTALTVEKCFNSFKSRLWKGIEEHATEKMEEHEESEGWVDADPKKFKHYKIECVKEWLTSQELELFFEWFPSWRSELQEFFLQGSLKSFSPTQESEVDVLSLDEISTHKKKRL